MTRAACAFEASPREVASARRFAGTVLAEWGFAPDNAVLVVSELAANAVRHARSGFEVLLEHDGATVIVEVTDASAELPPVPLVGPAGTGGRGLVIVDRLARAWGTRLMPDGGKTIWAEIPAW